MPILTTESALQMLEEPNVRVVGLSAVERLLSRAARQGLGPEANRTGWRCLSRFAPTAPGVTVPELRAREIWARVMALDPIRTESEIAQCLAIGGVVPGMLRPLASHPAAGPALWGRLLREPGGPEAVLRASRPWENEAMVESLLQAGLAHCPGVLGSALDCGGRGRWVGLNDAQWASLLGSPDVSLRSRAIKAVRYRDKQLSRSRLDCQSVRT